MFNCIYLQVFENEEYCSIDREICEDCPYRYSQEDRDFNYADMERDDF